MFSGSRVSPAPASASVPELIGAARAGSIRATARLLSICESAPDRAREVSAELLGRPRVATIIGVTGPPGVGKSTLTDALVAGFLAGNDARVAVVAVDPSSPFSGGALLGDRVRMSRHTTDPRVFLRSMSARGQLGGVSAATPAAVDLLSALGFDPILVETVGVGQSEVAVLGLADTVVVVTAPGLGDGIQVAKAGVLEIADLLVVNKADREGTATAVRELKGMLQLGRAGAARSRSTAGETPAVAAADPVGPGRAVGPGDGGRPAAQWRTPVVSTVATAGPSDRGVSELLAALDAHRDHLRETGLLEQRRDRRAALTLETLAQQRWRAATGSAAAHRRRDQLAAELGAAGDPHAAADAWWDWLTRHG